MHYQDNSQNLANAGHEPIARPDADALPAGSYGPASGNVITGEGTTTGASGADRAGPEAHLTAVQGAGGGSADGATLQAQGQYGILTADQSGNFSYVRNAGTPDGVQDVFRYTLADSGGATSVSTLTIDIGQVLNAQNNLQNIVALPAGVQMSDIHVNGRDLVIDMPDGTQMVIPGGAVFVPQLMIGDVELPASNLASLLIDSEPQPAAGPPLSSGGNFASDVPPLDPGVPLGDLIPPTEFGYSPPDFEEVANAVDTEPTVVIETPDFPAGAINATDEVDEGALAARGSEPPGSHEDSPEETTAGTIVFTAEDGLDSITINGVAITAVGQQIQGQYGVLTITSIDLASGQVGYTYTLADNTNGDATHDDFTVVVTDDDGDAATATLTIDIIDDVPTARNDTDTVDLTSNSATGNVMSGAGTTSGSAGADTVGADNAQVAAVSGTGGSDSSFDASGNLVVQGTYGTLTIKADGSYVYTPNQGVPGGSTDTFTYTLIDGDGDTSTATLTITNPDHVPTIVIETPDNPAGAVNATESVYEKGLPTRNGEPAGSGESADGNGSNNSDGSETNTGTIVFSSQDGVQSVTINGVAVTAVGQQIQGQYGVLTITGIDMASGEITYSYTLSDNTSGNNTADVFNIVVTDSDGDKAAGTLTVNIVDDVPTARNDTDAADLETHVATGNVMTGAGTTSGTPGADTVGADDAHVTAVSGAGGSDSTFDGSGNLVVQGQYGTLTIKADGSYVYTANENAPGGSVDVFTYTLTDGDGDTSTATLTIGNPDTQPDVIENVIVGLDDDALSGGNPAGTGDDPNAVGTSGSVAAVGGDGTITYSLSESGAPTGFTYQLQSNGDLWVLQGSTHVLTITLDQSGNYTVSQVAPIDHEALGDENNVSFTVTFTATDADGDSDSGTFSISVDDDTPLATADSNTVPSGEFGPVTGDVIANDSPGADGFGKVTGASSNNVPANSDTSADGSGDYQIQGQYGVLTINEDGTYSYLRDAGTPGGVSDVFTYTYIDGDGDPVSTTLTINIGNSTPDVIENVNIGLDDDALAGGNPGTPAVNDDPDASNTSGSVAAVGGDGTIVYTLSTSGAPAGFSYVLQLNGDLWVMQGTTHVLTVTLDQSGNYTVSQVAPIDHVAGDLENNQSFTITFTATDADGESDSGTFSISVDDDTPLATDDSNSIPSGQFGPVTGDVIANDSPGADGFGKVTGASSDNVPANSDTTADGSGDYQIQGEYGVLTINEDGSYSYLRDAGTPGGVSDVFTYTYVDGDGDPVSATLTISIGDSVPDVPENVVVGLDDDALTGGNPGTPAVNDDPDASNTSGSVAAVGGDGTITYSLSTAGAPSGFSYVLQLNGDLWVMQGTTHVLTVTLDQSGNYTVSQVAPIDHVAGNLENNQPFTITFTATDEDGSSDSGTFSISVDDDTPLATDDSNSIASGDFGPVTGNVISNDSPGADGFDKVTQIASNNVPANSDSSADGSGDYQVQGEYGVLTINEDGSYSYLRDAGTPGGVSDAFTYTYVDGDGDTVTAVLTISIGDSTPDVVENINVGLDDDALTGGNPGTAAVNDDPDASNTSGSVIAGPGGDGTITYSLSDAGAPAGFSYVLQLNGDLWVMQGTTHVLTVTLDQSGNYTVSQVAPIDHVAGNLENNQPFTITFTATDEDGSSDSGTFSISVDDDSPVDFTPQPLTDVGGVTLTGEDDAIVNDGTGHETNPLNDTDNNGVGENFIGADGFGSLVFTAAGHSDGEQLKDASGNLLTSGGAAIYMVGYGTDTLTGYQESGDHAGYQAGEDTAVVFTVSLDEGSGYGANSTYTIDFDLPIDDGSGFSFSDLSGGVAGNPPFKLIVESGQSTELLATPINGGSINSDQDDMGVDSQFIDTTAGADKGIRLDFGDFTYHANGGGTADDQFSMDSHTTVNGFKFTIDQVSNGTTADVHLVAYDADEDGGANENLPNASGDVIDPITSVKIYDNNGNLVGTFTGDALIDDKGTVSTADDVTIDFLPDGSVTIDNLPAQYSIQTYTADGYNAISITNPGNNDSSDTDGKYSLSAFSIETTQEGSNVDLSFDVTGTDADGDTATGTIDVTLIPAGSSTTLAASSVSSLSSPTSDAPHHMPSLKAMPHNDNAEWHRGSGLGGGLSGITAGALAAVGLAAFDHARGGLVVNHEWGTIRAQSALLLEGRVPDARAADDSYTSASQSVSQTAASSSSIPQTLQHGLNQAIAANHGSAADHSSAHSDAVVTQVAVHGAAPHFATHVTAAAVAMPSAEQIAAVHQAGADKAPTLEAAARSVGADAKAAGDAVHQVLADALHGGGGHGAVLDALINSLPGHGGTNAAHEALADHAMQAAVAHLDLGIFGASHGPHMAPLMEHMAVHADVAPGT